MKHGYGRVVYGADSVHLYYQGLFIDDQRHGLGSLYFEDFTQTLEGEWEHDECQEFEEFDSDEDEKHEALVKQ